MSPIMKNSVFIYFLFFLTSCSQQKKTDLKILFQNVEGLYAGSDVKMNGYTVGQVIDMKLLDSGILVSVHFKEKMKIPTGSKFIINQPLIGSPTINIEPSTDNSHLKDTDTVIGKSNEGGKIENLMSDSLIKKKVQNAVNKIGEGLKELIETVRAKDSLDQ